MGRLCTPYYRYRAGWLCVGEAASQASCPGRGRRDTAPADTAGARCDPPPGVSAREELRLAAPRSASSAPRSPAACCLQLAAARPPRGRTANHFRSFEHHPVHRPPPAGPAPQQRSGSGWALGLGPSSTALRIYTAASESKSSSLMAASSQQPRRACAVERNARQAPSSYSAWQTLEHRISSMHQHAYRVRRPKDLRRT